MSKKSSGRFVFLTIMSLAAIHILYYYPLLPDPVASHFDSSGLSDNQMSKGAYLTVYAGIIILIGSVFFLINYFLAKLPDWAINIKHKEYWLAPERREQTMSTINKLLFWYGSATLLFIILVMHLTFRINLGQDEKLGISFWVLLIIYGAITAGWTGHLILKFRAIPKHAN